jgi:hypothetical protein
MSRSTKKTTPVSQRDMAQRMLIERKGAGAGKHHTRERDVAKGIRRKGKHPERLHENPQQYKDQPIEITLKNERLDESSIVQLAPGVNLVMQISRTGKRVPVTHGEQRLLLCLQDDQGKRVQFYQSFAGTGGKQQGWWFPTGGVMADDRGRGAWIIKGSPRTDPGAGRVPLLEFYQRVNEVLPHTDPDTDAWLMRLVGMDYGDFSYKDEYEIVPFIRITEAGNSNELQKKWGSWCYQFWALMVLDKIWGKRTFTPERVAANPYKAAIPIVSGIAYVRNGGKTYSDLMEELRWLGPASVMKLVFNGNTRQCGESAFTVAQYLIERGFNARTDAGAGKYCSHFDLAVHTADQGWVSVDPTYIQFHAPNNESHALDIADRKLNLADDVHRLPVAQQNALVARFFEPTVQWSVAGMLDGTKAFEIGPAPHVTKEAAPSAAETPGQFHVGKTWRQHWEWYRGMAEDLTRGDFDEIDTYGSRGRSKSYWVSELSRRLMGKILSGRQMKTNPTDLEGRFIPERYLAGLPPALQKQRIRELTQSRDAYKRGDYSELPTDVTARKMGLVKQSNYTTEAKKRGIEYRGDLHDMAHRVMSFYGHRPSDREVSAFAEALRSSFAKGLAAWKSGGHRPGATAQNWAVARVNSLVVGGKTSWTADKKLFEVLPAAVRAKIESMRTKQNPIRVEVEGAPSGSEAQGRHTRFYQSRAALDRIEEQGREVVPDIKFRIVWGHKDIAPMRQKGGIQNERGERGVVTLVADASRTQRLSDANEQLGLSVGRSGKVTLYTAHTILHRLGDMIMPSFRDGYTTMNYDARISGGVKAGLIVTDRVERAWRNLHTALDKARSYLTMGAIPVEYWFVTAVDTKACRERWVNDATQALAETVPYRLLYKKGRENGVKLLSDLPFVPDLEAALTEYIDASMEMLKGYQVEI